ncbi:MAG: thioredoxin domain-containing protein [Sedimentibacter sp.]|uniref:thioredoxin domain-containing protein n=1 Tax=Sedimentibacter sp. TaxID=1960295 RepID=UPI002980F661|nr:thioredoxin domain-containing protein [Sedimentibacter sp.]MDW5298966.1 thioredoxin domain-containing protein [Sedimentibacter sp.]
MANSTKIVPNRLITEKSPYLLQHAFNPVDWYSWSEEAFIKAKREDKPVFLSIGYSSCHWCHVMEHESFEDDELAEVLNKHFVSIKVDREERPDIDAVYMNVAQRINGSGGWPLTIIMTPEQNPFFAGTYLPKKSRYGMTGLMELLQIVSTKWKNNKEELVNSGNKIVKIIRNLESNHQNEAKLSKKFILEARNLLEDNFDEEYGGFSEKPKFPQPSYLVFLLSYYVLEKDEDALYLVEKTLDSMYRGGIFDHVGYGFSRYSTDNKWLVPHFEKMLYDNAQLAYTYAFVYQITKVDVYKNIVEKIFEYILREMTDEKGGFYSAQDADSEGEEGKYYVFAPNEIIKVLGKEDGQYFNEYYNITMKGNFEGKNIPNLIYNEDYFEKNERIEILNKKIYKFRLNRMLLYKDDKILTSWNGMLIAALAFAYKVFGTEKYLQAAEKAIDFIENYLIDENNNVGVRYRDGSILGNGTLDDYVMFIWALVEMYEATFEIIYLERAVELNNKMISLFWDDEKGGFYITSKSGESLIYNPKEVYDGAMPSGNSVAAYNIMRLARLTGNIELESLAEKQMRFLASKISQYPAGYTFALLSVLYEMYTSKEIVCIAKDENDINELRKNLSHFSLVNTSVVAVKYSELEKVGKIIPYIKNYTMKNDSTTYYICQNKNCSLPITQLTELMNNL